MSKTIYYESVDGELIPCKFLGYICNDLDNKALVRVKTKRKSSYGPAGEIIDTRKGYIVNKTRVVNRCQYVASAVLPTQTPENTIKVHYVESKITTFRVR